MPPKAWGNHYRLFAPIWRPAALTHFDVVILTVLLALFASYRATDYMSTIEGETVGVIENTLPMWAWVWLCWLPSVLIFSGVAARLHRLIWAGHILGWITYTTLSVGAALNAFNHWPPHNDPKLAMPMNAWLVMCALLAALPPASVLIQRRRFPDSRQPYAWVLAFSVTTAFVVAFIVLAPAEGLRGFGPLAVMAALHLLLALRSGRKPISEESSAPDEVIISPTDG